MLWSVGPALDHEASKLYYKTCTVGADIALHSTGRTSLVDLIEPEGLQALDDLVCSAVRCADAYAILELYPDHCRVYTHCVAISSAHSAAHAKSMQFAI